MAVEKRQKPGVVDMCMGDKHIVNIRGIYRNFLIYI